MVEYIKKELIVPAEFALQRIDRVAAELLPQYSRAKIQTWLRMGQLLINGKVAKPKEKVQLNDKLELNAELIAEGAWLAQDIPLAVVFEDDQLIVINKTANFVVHPAPGHHSNTVVNAVLHHCPQLQNLPRAGIVHRLDKDTTGLMVIAKTLEAHHSLVEQLQSRTMGREYEAIVWGELTGGGKVEAAIARNPQNRQKMAVVASGKPAVTHYRMIRRYVGCSHLRLKLESGRTHQIRVHMAHIRHPVVGDPTYSGRSGIVKAMSVAARNAVAEFSRQALHAKSLRLIHPVQGKELSWEVGLPADMLDLIKSLSTED
jgi:23S rRNA pseudouridine1911/1915/1917 synthase